MAKADDRVMCQVRVWTTGRWHSHACDHPAKGVLETGPNKGKQACGVHLAAERRKQENERIASAIYDANRRRAAECRARADAVAARLGIPVEPNGDYGRVRFEDLEELADRLETVTGEAARHYITAQEWRVRAEKAERVIAEIESRTPTALAAAQLAILDGGS